MVILYFGCSYALCYTHYPQLWQSIIRIKDKKIFVETNKQGLKQKKDTRLDM